MTFAFIVAIAIGALAILLWRLGFFALGRYVPPAPRKAPAPVPATCAPPANPPAPQPGPLVLQNVTGGKFAADVISIDGQNTLTTDLVIVAKQLLKVSGLIQVPRQQAGDPQVNVTLICTDGEVHIVSTGGVDLGFAAPGARINGVGTTSSDPGGNGGHLVIRGVTIQHEGRILGADGGPGGDASVAPGNVIGWPAGSAVALSGCGGNAGEILLCAVEAIKLRNHSIIRGGVGGAGGTAITGAAPGGTSYARAGDSGASGFVRFEATAAACMVLIEAGADVIGGGDLTGSVSQSIAAAHQVPPNFAGAGSIAESLTGNGSTGGDVVFAPGCRVDSHGTIVSGHGGGGGTAQAFAGNGGVNAAGNGMPGGNATATGGRGGLPGAVPQWVNLAGQTEFGSQGKPGSGGEAKAKGGIGATTAIGSTGGSSGSSHAEGGASGNGNPGTVQHGNPDPHDSTMPSIGGVAADATGAGGTP